MTAISGSPSNNTLYSFEKAIIKDAETISKIVCNAFYLYDIFRAISEEGRHRTSKEQVEKEIHLKDHTWYVLRSNTAIVATALYISDNPKVGSIHMLAKDNPSNKDLGNIIIEEIVKYAISEGKEKLLLEVCDRNLRLISFYKKHHFELTGKSSSFCHDCPEVLLEKYRGKLKSVEMVRVLNATVGTAVTSTVSDIKK